MDYDEITLRNSLAEQREYDRQKARQSAYNERVADRREEAQQKQNAANEIALQKQESAKQIADAKNATAEHIDRMRVENKLAQLELKQLQTCELVMLLHMIEPERLQRLKEHHADMTTIDVQAHQLRTSIDFQAESTLEILKAILDVIKARKLAQYSATDAEPPTPTELQLEASKELREIFNIPHP